MSVDYEAIKKAAEGYQEDMVRFLREMIENLDADTIQMSFSKPQRAALIAPTQQHDENEDVLMLIMPVMLNY